MIEDEDSAGHRGFVHPLERLSVRERAKVYRKCKRSLLYFLRTVLFIKVRKEGEESGGAWEAFAPWKAQLYIVKKWKGTKRLLLLKARQLGMTWLILGIYVWKLLFRPGSEIGLTSRRMDEAKELLKRVKNMVEHLPTWLQLREPPEEDTKTVWELANGSRVIAFPTSAGDSYTFSDVLIDEADKCPLKEMLSSLKPTIDGGGHMVILSKAYKELPGTVFKHMCARALAGLSAWTFAFLPWWARPERDQAFYEAQKQESLDQDGTLDYLHGNYPATPQEALSAGTGNKRIPGQWLSDASELLRQAIPPEQWGPGAPALVEMRVYKLPVPGRSYGLGVDVAKGLPNGDDSTITVVDMETGEECAVVQGKLGNRDALPAAVTLVSRWYNHAPALIERNAIGEGTIAVLETQPEVELRCGPDGKVGYYKNAQTRTKLWDEVVAEIKVRAAERNQARAANLPLPPALVYDGETHQQLAGIERSSCKAPKGAKDDVSDSWGLAQWLRLQGTSLPEYGYA